MLKFIFWSLLCINGVLLAYSQGVLGNFKGNEREPARMKNQLNTGKLVLLSAARASVPAPAPEPAADKPAALTACVEFGNLGLAEARRFEAKLAPLELGERLSRQAAGMTDPTSHIVYIAPQGSREAAERKAAELKNQGVANYFIMADSSPLKWGISLGVFKSEAAAQTLLAALGKRGVQGVRMVARGAQVNKLAFRFRGIDAATRARIDDAAAGFTALESRNCR